MKTRTRWTVAAVACIIASGAMLFAVTGAIHAQAEDPPERFHYDKDETQPPLVAPARVQDSIPETGEVTDEDEPVAPTPASQIDYGPGVIDDISWAEHEKKLFVGHWRLVSFVRYDEEGNATERPMTGRIMYDSAGNMSAQLMPAGDDVEAENGRTRGYVAYFGTYELEPAQRWVTHRPEGSNIYAWVGGELKRRYRFEDGKLLLSLEREDRTTGTLTWERIRVE